MEGEKRVSVKEFRDYFGLNDYTARNLVRIRDFPSVRLGWRYYVDIQRAEEWFKKKETQGVKWN